MPSRSSQPALLSLLLAGLAPPREPLEPAPFTLEQRLLDAARHGDRATLERALARGVSVDAKDDLGRSSLLLAARDAGSLELVRCCTRRAPRSTSPTSAGARRSASPPARAGSRSCASSRRRARRSIAATPDGARPLPRRLARSPGRRRVPARQRRRRERRDRFGDTPLMRRLREGLRRDGGAAARARRRSRAEGPGRPDRPRPRRRERAACLGPRKT